MTQLSKKFINKRVLSVGERQRHYLSQERSNNAFVSLKIFHLSKQEEEEAYQKIITNALTLNALKHPKIALIHHSEKQGNVFYLYREYLKDPSFFDMLSKKDSKTFSSEQQVAQIALQIVKALDAAHQKGILHGNLHLKNVFLSKEFHVKITDFSMPPKSSPCEPFFRCDAPEYDSLPKISSNPPKNQDIRSDVHSLGLVLIWLLVKDPLSIASMEPKVLFENKEHYFALNFKKEFMALLDKMCGEDPENFYSSYKVLKQDLEFLLECFNASSLLKTNKQPSRTVSSKKNHQSSDKTPFVLLKFPEKSPPNSSAPPPLEPSVKPPSNAPPPPSVVPSEHAKEIKKEPLVMQEKELKKPPSAPNAPLKPSTIPPEQAKKIEKEPPKAMKEARDFLLKEREQKIRDKESLEKINKTPLKNKLDILEKSPSEAFKLKAKEHLIEARNLMLMERKKNKWLDLKTGKPKITAKDFLSHLKTQGKKNKEDLTEYEEKTIIQFFLTDLQPEDEMRLSDFL